MSIILSFLLVDFLDFVSYPPQTIASYNTATVIFVATDRIYKPTGNQRLTWILFYNSAKKFFFEWLLLNEKFSIIDWIMTEGSMQERMLYDSWQVILED